MESIWLRHYPQGVPAQIDPRCYASLREMLEQSCNRYRARPAFTSMGTVMRYGELDQVSRNFAAYLQQAAGLSKGERIAILLPNLLQYPVALFGILRAGLVAVNVNPRLTARELQYQLADSGAKAVVVLENFAHTLQQALPATSVRHVITTRVGDLLPPLQRFLVDFSVQWLKRGVPHWDIPAALSFRRALQLGARHALREVPLVREDIALLQYTGATTGTAKGVILSHGNLLANVEQISAWIDGTLHHGEEVVITPLPLYHIFALTANLLIFVEWGCNNVLIADPRNVPALLRTLKRTRFTVISGVDTLYKRMLDMPGLERVKKANGDNLKLAVAGGMAVQRTIAERWQRVMGIPLIEGYGLTEASPIVCANRFDLEAFSGSMGLPLPSTQVAILDDNGHALPQGEAGEICVRGPQVMQGYWNQPEETARAFTADGWLRTGDIGVMEADGAVRFVDRRKDVIVVSGFKVYPAEVEAVVLGHPEVREAAVVGMPDDNSGEAVKLYVVPKSAALTVETLLAHCRAGLAAYKVPKHVEFRIRLPKSPIGKVLRRVLKDEATSA